MYIKEFLLESPTSRYRAVGAWRAGGQERRLRHTLMFKLRLCVYGGVAAIILSCCLTAAAQTRVKDENFGPVVRAYLGYLRNEQEVVDDRISRREITANYYRRNSNRIRALREMAIRLVTKSGNDYVPELEAVTSDEFGILFETRPSVRSFRLDQVIANTFR